MTTVAAALLATGLAVSGCGGREREEPRDGLEPDTARFSYGDRQVEVPLTSCGLDEDEDVMVLAGRRGAVVIQAAADLGEDGSDRTGVTADLGAAGILGAFGAELEHGPAGEIEDVRIDGDRLIVEGTWVTLDGQLEPSRGASADRVTGELRARCPEDGEGERVRTIFAAVAQW